MKVSTMLYKAGDLLRERGWTQRIAQDADGKLCIAGAIRVAAGFHPRDGENGLGHVSALAPHEDTFISVFGGDAIVFNNEFCETADDAIAALNICADIIATEGK